MQLQTRKYANYLFALKKDKENGLIQLSTDVINNYALTSSKQGPLTKAKIPLVASKEALSIKAIRSCKKNPRLSCKIYWPMENHTISSILLARRPKFR